MQKKGANISLKGYDDIFSTDQSRAEAQQERVQEIPLSELHPFEGHPFRVVDDEEMMKTAESVRDFGVLTPAIVRPDPDGGYEIVSGHRRHRASELAGKETMPAIVRDLDDDAAIILMVDANLQRESILPSERAFAYKMKLDAIKHQGQRTDLTSSQVGMKLQAMDIVGQEAGESRNQVHRYIRLTELIPELLDMVDTGQIKFNPAVELSYLASEEQKDFLSAMDYLENLKTVSALVKNMPSLGMLTVNALAAADNVLIPVQAAYLPAKGLEQLLGTINKVKRQINPKLKIEGILLTMVDSRTNYSKDIGNLIRESYGGKLKVYKTDIPRSVRAEEISAEGTSIFKHDPKGKVAEAYKVLTKEVLNNAEKRRKHQLEGVR